MIERVEVMRGSHDPSLFGPLPGLRIDNVVANEFQLPPSYRPNPGRTSIERIFVLLDVGVAFDDSVWFRGELANTWYVDLVSCEQRGNTYTFRDLYIDLMIPTDGRHYRMLDLDEFADAMEDGSLSLAEACDGLRRWQRFLDRYVHAEEWPPRVWTDFPPECIRELQNIPSPFGEPVLADG